MRKANRLARTPRNAAALVAIRARLLQHLARHRAWARTEAGVAERLRAHFAANPPTLRRIDLNTSPAILAQIVRYEAVHAIRGLADLRRRLADDRRCYALFSDALPDEPLVFIELAFTHGMCGDVSTLLDTGSPAVDPSTCDCAMFYSISSCHEGLRGVPFGNLLIRFVVDKLQYEMPWLRTFATVSPVPGFRAWLADTAKRCGGELAEAAHALDANGWAGDPNVSARLAQTLLPFCAAYLLGAKRGDEPLDSVARFHLGNGARLEQINWLGDRSDAGFERSAGIVANYLYDLPTVDRNRETFASSHDVIAAARVTQLAQEAYRSF